jgi:hypothetical protein
MSIIPICQLVPKIFLNLESHAVVLKVMREVTKNTQAHSNLFQPKMHF